ncbi:MAG: hypothetical protein M3Q08_02530 [Pseudomonadota bacterium]|jgi:hypothetical protein|nr:hypothetical protein [Pseudomonadota bacterium]
MTDDRDTERNTTVVHTERRGGGGTIALAIVLLLILVLLFVFRNDIFGGGVSSVPEKVDVEVSVPGTKGS